MRDNRVRRMWLGAAAVGLVGAASRAVYRQIVSGALTLDTGIGRRTRPLGPLTIDIDAPRELVFDVIAAPYLGKAGSTGGHLDVLHAGSDLVVAAHRTPVADDLATTTVESVGFDRPSRVTFRLLRGPVPHVVETFELEAVGESTRLRYDGELGTDFWGAGAAWGAAVAQRWERAVAKSFGDIRRSSEQRAAAHRRRAARAVDSDGS